MFGATFLHVTNIQVNASIEEVWMANIQVGASITYIHQLSPMHLFMYVSQVESMYQMKMTSFRYYIIASVVFSRYNMTG
jgi:hypothetical protein